MVTAESTGGLIPQADLDLIKSRISIDELLRGYDLQLVEAGGGRLKALCPFHNEKTPSFSVNVDKQFYYCFGCQAGGNIFTFVKEYERVGFPEAAEILAQKAGVVIQRTAERDEQYHKTLAVFEALKFAEDFYHDFLLRDPGAEGVRQYLAARNINQEMQARFRIGCAPAGWDELLEAAVSAGHSTDSLSQAGLIRENKSGKGRGFFDEFRGKLIFPIGDAQERTIGFGARRLAGDDDPAKYRNTRETRLFNKSRVLYGLSQSKPGIRRTKAIVVVEGYTDAIMAHQAGLDHFVASLGTAFTKENTQSLKRYADRVYMIFDGDSAGLKAAERSLELLVGENLDVLIYPLADGKDPCDAISELGGEAFWQKVQEDSVDIFEFKWKRTIESSEAASSPQALSRAVGEFLSLVAKISDKIARRVILNKYVEKLGLHGISREDLPLEKLGLLTPAKEEPSAPEPQLQESRMEPLLKEVLKCMVNSPAQAQSLWESVPSRLIAGEMGEALDSYVKRELSGGGFKQSDKLLHDDMHPALRQAVFDIFNEQDDEPGELDADSSLQVENCEKDLRRWGLRDNLKGLKEERALACKAGETERELKLRKEITGLRKELSRLRTETMEAMETDELTMSG